VEEALNDVVVSTQGTPAYFRMQVEEVLAVSTYDSQLVDFILGEKVLKAESVSTHRQKWRQENQVEEILNTKGSSHDFVQEAIVQELFKNMIDNVSPDSDPDYPRVEDVISHHNSSIRE
jgi:alpha-acetolactate decarboxylase